MTGIAEPQTNSYARLGKVFGIVGTVISVAILTFLAITFVSYGASERAKSVQSEKVIAWMETQAAPDICGYQGEFPHHYSNGKPCFTKSGYRFVSGADVRGDFSTPFRRVVRIRHDAKWTMDDVIITWAYDPLLGQMQLYTGSSRDMDDLMIALPEITRP